MCFSLTARFRRRSPVNPVEPPDAPAGARGAAPSNTTHNTGQVFEADTTAQIQDDGGAHIALIDRNTVERTPNDRTHAERLLLIETREPPNLDQNLVGILQDHDELYHTAFRSRHEVSASLTAGDVESLCLVADRIFNIRLALNATIAEITPSEDDIAHLIKDELWSTEFDKCAQLLEAEIAHQLTDLKELIDASYTDIIEFENIGADHNVDDHGRDITYADSSVGMDDDDQSGCDTDESLYPCCICKGAYTAEHTPFNIAQCKHVVGKACLSTWLNSTNLNANLCPLCRTQICARRPRRPADIPEATECRRIAYRLTLAFKLLGHFERLQDELFGAEVAAEALEQVIKGVNYHFFTNGIDYYLHYEAGEIPTWGVQTVDWYS